jgi:hypothetical protein
MICMAKQRPKPRAASPAGDRHKNPAIGFRPEEGVRDILARLALADQRSLAHMTEILVKEALVARGFWPAKDDEGAK